MESRIAAFTALAALLTITPGADMALVTRNVLQGGMRAGLGSTLGINLGCFAWGAASGVGIAAVLAASATAFTALKLAGAAYLIFLGLQAIRQTFQAIEAQAPPARGSPFRQGLLTNLLNPKIAVFYTTVLPQFIAPGEPAFLLSLLLAGIHNLLGFVWLTGYSWAVTRAGDVLRRPLVRRMLERITGTVLIAFGIRLAFERR